MNVDVFTPNQHDPGSASI